jgi:hypothetical protein
MMQTWSEDTLEQMRKCGDPLADETVAALAPYGEAELKRLFQIMRTSDAQLTHGDTPIPRPLQKFIEATSTLPPNVDIDRIRRGDDLFLDNAMLAGLGLLAKSLPSGYAAPRLAKILHFTGNLERHPYRRVLAVLQLLANISAEKAFKTGGLAVVTAQKLRLLHAGLRYVVRRDFDDYDEARWGAPISQEDLVFTIATFSCHVVEALRSFGVPLDENVAEDGEKGENVTDDYYYLWRVYGELQGIKPEWMPQSLAEAQAFCAAYGRRHFVGAEQNPEGVALTQAELRMMRDLLPRWLRVLGFGALPKLMMVRLLGPEAAARVGVTRQPGHYILEWLLLVAPLAWHKLWGELTPSHAAHNAVSRLFFQTLIRRAWGGEVTFEVPYSKQGIKNLA